MIDIIGKRGAVNWTIGKLLNIVLLVVLLVMIVYGTTTGGLNPLIDNLGQKFDDTLFFVQSLFGGGSYDNCYVASVSSMGGGDDFLKELGLDTNSNVVINYGCENICNISGTEFGAYRIEDGVFERFEGGIWNVYDSLFSGNLSLIKFYWGLYNGGVGALGKGGIVVSDGNLTEDSAFSIEHNPTEKFVLYGDGTGPGDEIIAIWQNNKWEVREGPRDSSRSEKRFHDILNNIDFAEDGREVVYAGTDDDKVFEMFYDTVYTPIVGINDNVYWKVLGPNEVYNEITDKGENIGRFVASGFNNKYDSIVAAEHGRGSADNPNYDLWIRTKVHGSGSTAYGPVQMTQGLAQGYLDNNAISWSEDERDYLRRFVDQGWKFLAHGGMRENGVVDAAQIKARAEEYKRLGIKIGDSYDANYDYGGSGDMISEEDKSMYRQVTMKMIEEIYQRNGRSKSKLCGEWRFGLGGKCMLDPLYYFKFMTIWRDYESSSKLDSSDKFNLLRSVFERERRKMLMKVASSEEEVKAIGESVSGKTVSLDGEIFDIGIVSSGSDFIITLSSDKKGKFGLRYFPYIKTKIDSSFLPGAVGLSDLPFILVRWNGGVWEVVGNEDYYRLPKNKFDETYKASMVNKFLREKCIQ